MITPDSLLQNRPITNVSGCQYNLALKIEMGPSCAFFKTSTRFLANNRKRQRIDIGYGAKPSDLAHEIQTIYRRFLFLFLHVPARPLPWRIGGTKEGDHELLPFLEHQPVS